MLFLLGIALYCYACNPARRLDHDFTYFQRGMDSLGTVTYKEPPIQNNDLLSIQVYSATLNQEQALLFNLPNTGGNPTSTGTQGPLVNNVGYLVDNDGNVEMPIIGKLKATGLTRGQLSEVIAVKLKPYVKDPEVLVRYLQFKINILGEVKNPGAHVFTSEKVTIIDALSTAGDLTDRGKRQDVTVIREENGVRKSYIIDLRSGAMFQSPVYQLMQNDVVYVGPTKNKLKEVKINPNTQRDLQIAVTLASFAALFISILNILK